MIDQPSEQHVYHHTDLKPPTVSVTITRNTKGIGWEVDVQGAESVEQAVAMATTAVKQLRAEFGAEEVA